MGGKAPSVPAQTTTTQINEPSAQLRPYIGDILSRGQASIGAAFGEDDVDPALLNARNETQQLIESFDKFRSVRSPAQQAVADQQQQGHRDRLNQINQQIRTASAASGSRSPIQDIQAQLESAKGFDPLQIEGQNALLDFIRGRLPQFITQEQDLRGKVDPLRSFLQGLIQRGNYDPQNEITQNLISASLDPVRREFTEVLRPQQSSQDVLASGGPGGTRGQVHRAQLDERYLNQIGNIAAQIQAQQQQQAIQNALAGGQLDLATLQGLLAPSLQRELGLSQLGPQLLSGVGDVRKEQQLQDVNLSQQGLNLPFDLLQRFAGLLGSVPGGSQSATTGPGQVQPRRTSPLISGLGGALSGAAAGTAINPGIGTAIGALIGGLTGGFS